MGAASSARAESVSGLIRRWFDRWIARRGPIQPPLALRYRQIFILPTRFGWLFGMLMFAMLMGSLNFNNNLGLLTTFIVAGLALNSMLIAYRNLDGLRIQRTGTAPVFAGQTAELLITLASDSTRPRLGLEIATGGQVRSFCLPASGTTEIAIPIPTRHRGWLQPRRCRVQTRQPIGLFQAWSWFWPERPILVWPRPAENPPALPEGPADRDGLQDQRQPDGDEFFSLRNWREGDPLHRVAWKASQRHDTLLARELRRPRSRHLVLDLARTPGLDREERIRVLTAWCLQSHQQQRTWTLVLGPDTLGPDHGEAHLQACLKALATFQ